MHPSQPDELAPLDEPGDAELISAVRGGDLDAYGQLFQRHVDSARRLARQLVSAGDVDDLVSDAFAKVLAVLQRGGGPDLAFRAYLLTSLRRLHVDRLRAGARLTSTDDLTPYDPGVPFDDTAVAGFDNAAAAKAFASLPERWQQVLWHTEVEGQKPAEIAPLLGISANSVSALAYRAREGLRQAFISMHAQDATEDACATTRAAMGAHLRGGTSRRDAARVEEHLGGCRECSGIYLELAEVNNDLGAVLAPLLLGSAGASYLAAAHLGAAGASKGGVLVFLDRTKDWMLHNPAGRLSAGAGGAVAAAAVVAAVAFGHGGTAPVAADRALPTKAPSAAPTTSSAPTTAPTTSPTTSPRTRPTPGRSPAPATAPAGTSLAQQAAASSAAPGLTSGNTHPVIRTPLSPVDAPTPATPVTVDVTKGAVDPGGGPLRVTSARVAPPAHGTVMIDRGSARSPARRALTSLVTAVTGGRDLATSITYTPDTGWRGTDTIDYVLADGRGGTVSGSVKIRTPDASPVAADDTVAVAGSWAHGAPSRIDVLANDHDDNHDRLRVTRVSAPAHGIATLAAGAVAYAPVSGYTGADSFRYTISDGHGGGATATVSVTVGALPDRAPTAGSTSATVAFEAPLTVDLSGLASDPDGDHLTYAAYGAPAHGTVSIAPDGTATYHPDSGFAGHDSFGYTVSDGRGASATGSVAITVQQPASDLRLTATPLPVSGYEHVELSALGIPSGHSATLHLHVTGITGWSTDNHVVCGQDIAVPASGDLDLACPVDADGELLHLDFDVAPGWSVDASITPNDFTDSDSSDNSFHRDGSTPLGS